MKGSLLFLGTGTSGGVPLLGCSCEVCASTDIRNQRLRSSVLIQTPEVRINIDCGPDFRQQLLRARISAMDHILFTHGHRDHIAGIDDIRSLQFTSGQPVSCWMDSHTLRLVKEQFGYIFDENPYPGAPKLDLHIIDEDQDFLIDGISFTPIRVMHLKLPVLGFRWGDITYITDANFIDLPSIEKMKGTRILILNALRKTRHISHFSLEEAIAVSEQVGAETTYFTHISHQLGLHQDIEESLPKGIFLAYDGLELSWNQ